MILPPNSIIVSGPVIIENNKVLLDRENKNGRITPWFFPGGEVEDFNEGLENACRREVKEEMGIDIEILKPLKPIMLYKGGRVVMLIHWLSKRIGEIKPGPDIRKWEWFDINKLPNDCAPNIKPVIEDYKKLSRKNQS